MTTESKLVRPYLIFLVFLAPACRTKNVLLRWLGYNIARSAHIGPNVVYNVGRMTVGENAVIGPLNVFRSLLEVTMEPKSIIGQLNWFSMAPEFRSSGGISGSLRLEDSAAVVSRHYIDCSGGVILHPFALLAGVNSIILTHQLVHSTNVVEAKPVEIGSHSVVNAANRLVPGTYVPDRSITGIAAVLLPGYTEPDRLYAGVPARDVKSVAGGLVFQRRAARSEVDPAVSTPASNRRGSSAASRARK